MCSPEQVLEELRQTYERQMLNRARWLNLAKASMGKAVLGQIYASNLSNYLKSEQVLGHNGLALGDAMLAGAGVLISAVIAEDTAASTRITAASFSMPIPEWAVRRASEE